MRAIGQLSSVSDTDACSDTVRAGDVRDVRAERRQAVHRGQPLPGRGGQGHVSQQVGLDVERGHDDAMQLATRREGHALCERPRPPAKAAVLPLEPVVVDLHADR